MKKSFLYFIILLLSALGPLNAQTVPDSLTADTVALGPDSLVLSLDSLLARRDTLLPDSLRRGPDSLGQAPSRRDPRMSQIQLSPDSLDAQVDYSAKDSMIYNIKDRRVYLYGDAKVVYQDLTLEAAFIEFDWGNNTVIAEGRPDSTGRLAGNPYFQDRNQNFQAKRMRYNFKTRKGIVYNVNTKQGNDLYVLGARAKFLGNDPRDSTAQDVVYSEDAIFTTCDHPNPHFGIRSQKQKVIPNKMVVVGPSNLEIEGIPTPLWLPFGFYPISKTESTGLIFPKDYQFDENLGFGFQEIGWYFPIGEQFDLKLTGDIFTRGTYRLRANARYNRIYKYNGSLGLTFADIAGEDAFALPTRKRSLSLNWSHRQDSKAHPFNQLSGSVNIQTNGFQRENNNDPNSKQQNSLSSNISFSRRFAAKPYNFSASFNHSQNTSNHQMTITLPELSFSTGNLYPFKLKIKKGGKDQWYEKVAINYSANARNRFTTTDSTLFTQQTLQSAQTAMKQDLTANVNFKLFKYFNVQPSVGYSENWYLQTLEKVFDPTPTVDTNIVYLDVDGRDSVITYDTLKYGTVRDTMLTNLKSFHNLKSAGVGISTNIFGTMLFRKGKIRGIRHSMSPSVNFNYKPDYSGYYQTVDTDTREEFNKPLEYSIFDRGVFDRPNASGRQMNIGYGIGNNVEMKLWSKRDSTTRNVKLLESLSVGGNYNYALDSLNFSDLNFSGNTSMFKRLITFRFGALYSPYALNDRNVKVNTFQYDVNKKILRFVNANLTIGTNFSLRQMQDLIPGLSGETTQPQSNTGNNNRSNITRKKGDDSLLDVLSSLRISHDFKLDWSVNTNGNDTLVIKANTLRVNVDRIQITEHWRIGIQQFGYDFVGKGFIYPSFTFYRDLHCWEMSLGWQPTNGTFNFSLKVKPGTLEFIKVPYQKGTGQFNGGF